jgi:hypothetical protein
MKYIYCIKQTGKITYVGYSEKVKPSCRMGKGAEVILLDAMPDESTVKELKDKKDVWRKMLKYNKEQT